MKHVKTSIKKDIDNGFMDKMIADNDNFRPDDNVSKVEALKMIFK